MMTEIEKYIHELLELIYRKDDLDQLLFDISLFADKVGYNTVSQNVGDDPEDRKQFITEKIAAIDSDLLKNFFLSLIRKDDLWLFEPGHLKIFIEELNKVTRKAVYFSVTTAIDLTETDLQKICHKLSKQMEKKVVIEIVVDPNLLGGAIIKKDNFILDFSLKTKLYNLSNQWKKTIQQAR